MEKKNLMFRFVVKDSIKENFKESYQLGLDGKRTARLREAEISTDERKHEYYVFSPLLELHLPNNDPTRYDGDFILTLPGKPGEWTDNEDSYTVRIEKVSEDYCNEKYLFNIKVYNYASMDTILLDINVYFNKYTFGGRFDVDKYAQFSNQDDKTTIDKIRKTLSDCVEEYAILDYINQ